MNIKRVFLFSLQILSELDEILRKMHIVLYVKYPLFLSDFNKTSLAWTYFRKILISNFVKILPVVSELFLAYGLPDGQTGVTKLIVTLSSSVIAPKNAVKWLSATLTFWRRIFFSNFSTPCI